MSTAAMDGWVWAVCPRPECDWKGPLRQTELEAKEDEMEHGTEVHGGELTLEVVADAIGFTRDEISHQCHAVSLAILRAGLVQGRVARGRCHGVRGQHSWIVEGPDCYDPEARIIDATLWSYDPTVEGVWTGTLGDGLHHPHGWLQGLSVWHWGRPDKPTGRVLHLAPTVALSDAARAFLKALGPLDRRGWSTLANDAPVAGWPAGEILGAMADTPELAALVPIDRLGMLTDRNPGGVYLVEAG